MSPAATEALPVRLRIAGSEAGAVERWVGSLGWQTLGADPAAPVAPAVVLADVAGALRDGDDDRADVILLVAEHDDPSDAARAAARPAVRAVLGWPDERAELPAVAASLLGGVDRTRVADLRVAGSAGGVGTTTVAMALGGLSAWRGRRTLVLRGPASPDADVTELDGTVAWRGAQPVPGIRDLRLLDTTAPGCPVGEGPAALVVRDLGVGTETDVLVVRRDRSGLAAVTATSAGVVVVTDVGPVPPPAMRRAAAGRRLVTVPWSHRVARADVRGRVPAGLPGSWLRLLDRVVAPGGGAS